MVQVPLWAGHVIDRQQPISEVVGIAAFGNGTQDVVTQGMCDYVIGCANGDVAVITFDPATNTLTERCRANIGALFSGGRNSIQAMFVEDGSGVSSWLIGLSVDGGYRLLELREENLGSMP